MATIDDTDATWLYTGDWALITEQPAFDQTVHLSANAGVVATLSFTGVQVSVFGTIASLGDGPPPQTSYSIDGGPATTLSQNQVAGTTQYQHLFFQSGTLAAGAHTLTIQNLLGGGRLYIDYATVQAAATSTAPAGPASTPSAPPATPVTTETDTQTETETLAGGAPSSSTATVTRVSASIGSSSVSAQLPASTGPVVQYTTTLDDRDPAVVYTGAWHGGANSAEYGGTDTWTNATGAAASVAFLGVQISVCGTIDALGTGRAPRSSYSIDGGPLTVFTATQQNTPQYRQCFFQSAMLPSSLHTLVVQNEADGGDLRLDYISVGSIDPPGGSSPSPTESPASPTAVAAKRAKSAPVGAVVGGVLGGLVLIALGVTAVFYLRRKRKGRIPPAQQHAPERGERVIQEVHVSPFVPLPEDTLPPPSRGGSPPSEKTRSVMIRADSRSAGSVQGTSTLLNQMPSELVSLEAEKMPEEGNAVAALSDKRIPSMPPPEYEY